MSEYFLFNGRKFVPEMDSPQPRDVAILPLAEYVKWQDGILAERPNVYRIRKWGDPIMVSEGGLSVKLIPSNSNFQAVGTWNKSNSTMGGVSNYLRIPLADYRKIGGWQPDDEYLDKRTDYVGQKLGYLSGYKGTVYFWFHLTPGADDWTDLTTIEWGTIGLGGNLVTVEGIEIQTVKTPDGVRRTREMARLRGFRKTDWARPLEALLEEGLVHRCFGAYTEADKFGDSPKGIVYTPFWSPRDWVFIGPGQTQPAEFYVPVDWLEK